MKLREKSEEEEKPQSKATSVKRALRRVGHQIQRPLEPLAFHELVQRLPHEGLEDAVEVEGGEAGRLGHLPQPQGLSEVAHDVVHRAVDALDVVAGNGARDFSIGSQDMASYRLRFSGMLALRAPTIVRPDSPEADILRAQPEV